MTKAQLIKKYWKLNTILQDGMFFDTDSTQIEEDMQEIEAILDEDFDYQII